MNHAGPARYAAPIRTAPAQERQKLALLMEGATLLLSMIIVWTLSAQVVSPLWSIVSFCNFVWLCVFLFRVAPRAIVIALPYIITRSSTIVALVLIEFGAEIPELGTVGTAGTHTASFVFYVAILFGAYAIMFQAFFARTAAAKSDFLTRFFDRWATLIAMGAIAVIGLVALWMILRGLISGFPLLIGADRFAYRRFSADKIVLYALNLKFIIAYILGFIVFRSPVPHLVKLMAIGLSTLLLLLYFMFGDKFFTQLAAMSAFFGPYLFMNFERVKRNIVAFTLAAMVALGAVFSVTWWIYSDGGAATTAATLEKLGGRIVGQGELWYVQSYVGAPLLNWDSHLVDRNIQALRVKAIDPFAQRESLGAAYFSNKYAPDTLRASLARNNGSVTYTMAAEPLGLAAFGWVGLGVLLVLCALAISVGNLLIARAIVQRLPLSIIFGAYILIQTQGMLNQGAPWVVFSIFNLKWLGVIAAIELGLIALAASQKPKPTSRRRPQWR